MASHGSDTPSSPRAILHHTDTILCTFMHTTVLRDLCRDENLGAEIEQDYLSSPLCADPSANGKNSIFYETIIF